MFVQLEDLQQFRQLNSQTPGHPENFVTEGIEVTTGETRPGRSLCKTLGAPLPPDGSHSPAHPCIELRALALEG